jgi:hypothetical protein
MKNTLIFALYLVVTISAMTWFSLTGNVNPYSFPPATQALEILKLTKEFKNIRLYIVCCKDSWVKMMAKKKGINNVFFFGNTCRS